MRTTMLQLSVNLLAQRKHLLKKDNKMRVSNMKGKIPSLSNFRRFQARPNIIKRNVKKIRRAQKLRYIEFTVL